jgi:RNA polymerase sigma-70 factor (ECF subfamily)
VSLTDQELLDAARGGDKQSLETLLKRHQARVYRFGMRMCRDPEDARDILQDTLLTMARSLSDFQGKASLSTWLYSVARSYCIKKRRKSKFAPARVESLEQDTTREAEALVDSARAADESLAAHELHEVLEQGLQQLPAEQREVLLLRDVEGLTAPEVADVLELSVAAVKSRLHRARAALRSLLAPALEGRSPAATSGASACPDILGLYSRHLEGEIDAELCSQMESHVEGCARCRQSCDGLKQILHLCQAAPGPSVPESVQRAVREKIAMA